MCDYNNVECSGQAQIIICAKCKINSRFNTLQHHDVLTIFMGQGILRVIPSAMHLSVHCSTVNDADLLIGCPIFIKRREHSRFPGPFPLYPRCLSRRQSSVLGYKGTGYKDVQKHPISSTDSVRGLRGACTEANKKEATAIAVTS